MDIRTQQQRAIALRLIDNLGPARAQDYCRQHHWFGVLKLIQTLVRPR